MTATYKGATLVESYEWNYSQDEGARQVRRVRGIPISVNNWARNVIDDGYDVTVSQGRAYSEATATKTYNYAYRPVIEHWTLSTEILDKDIWSDPEVMADMYAYTDGPAAYKKAIEDAVDQGTTPNVTGPNSAHIWLIKELSRGVEAYEHEYHILSRTVTFPMYWLGHTLPAQYNMTLQLSRQIVKSSTLAAQQNIPAEVLFSLPAERTPAEAAADAAVYVQWGWRIREQRAEIDTSTTGSFSMSWTYAAWSTFLYTPEA